MTNLPGTPHMAEWERGASPVPGWMVDSVKSYKYSWHGRWEFICCVETDKWGVK